MRTTLNLRDELMEAAKRRAAETGRTLTALIEDALAAELAERPGPREPYRLEIRTHRGRFVGRADVADRDSLFDAMEGRR